MKYSTIKADLLLLIAAVIWGSGFVAQKIGMEHIGPMLFTGIRFGIGSLFLLPFIWYADYRKKPEKLITAHESNDNAASKSANTTLKYSTFFIRGGLLAGTVLFIAAALQQIGMVYTTPGKAGFITGLYVIFVPVINLIAFKEKTRLVVLAGAMLAIPGLYFLSITPGSWHIKIGDVYIILCSVVWAWHVTIIGWYSPKTNPVKLAAFQFALASALGFIAALLITEEINLSHIYAARWAILYSGVLSVGVAFSLQVIAQRNAPAAHAALLLSLEAVFAAIAGWLIMHETFTGRKLIGCTLLFAGILISQIRPKRKSAENKL